MLAQHTRDAHDAYDAVMDAWHIPTHVRTINITRVVRSYRLLCSASRVSVTDCYTNLYTGARHYSLQFRDKREFFSREFTNGNCTCDGAQTVSTTVFISYDTFCSDTFCPGISVGKMKKKQHGVLAPFA